MNTGHKLTAEEKRLRMDREKKAYWKRWGPYLSERQWGTVREDYSPGGTSWEYLPHDHARSRAYRWGEDGIAGISDNHARLCFALALWNGHDTILKERLFGLTGNEGNHGEDVKEYYYYLDNTPSHAYMKYIYKYPHKAYPYDDLVEVNKYRSRQESEYELIDTGVFDEDRYFDVFVEYAKNSPEDILVLITVANRGPAEAVLHLLPTLWFRNTWSWNGGEKPSLRYAESEEKLKVIEATHPDLGKRWLYCDNPGGLLFTDNETNFERIFGSPNECPYVKDGINDYIVSGKESAINNKGTGTKVSAHYALTIAPGKSVTVKLRLSDTINLIDPFGKFYENVFNKRKKEADEFYKRVCPYTLPEDLKSIQRQAFAGMLWTKQFYYYVIEEWLNGDPLCPPPPESRKLGRNHNWIHIYNEDILSMPDKWEYPWFAAWDLAFHTVNFSMIDPDFAKRQLMLLTREWYMHPNGQIPAYEWAFGDVNPPVHAWAAWRVYNVEHKMYGRKDVHFLERVFQKLLLNFTWWVNRKDAEGKNVFEGGFLGLDNIGVFDRNATLPSGVILEQADGTSWMGMYCLNMLAIAIELAKHNTSYEDIASKFFEHFLYIARAINLPEMGHDGLWDDEDQFYYDVLHLPNGNHLPLKVRSMVGLIPLYAIETIEPEVLVNLKGFKQRMEWFIENRPDLGENVASMEEKGVGERRLLSIVDQEKLRMILKKMLDENEFLSPYGIRALSKYHRDNPYEFSVAEYDYTVDYEPAESTSGLFGGNSNWRGPVWFPANFLLIEALQKFHYYLGDSYRVECPTGSGKYMSLWEVANEISHRLIRIFKKDESGKRPVYGGTEKFQTDPNWSCYINFYEYFHGDNGAGIGASHQTGWTGLVAKLIRQAGEYGSIDEI
jgi:Mannosylglycerate hydrolase MGH1-like glycoside hydrolase domain